ncbi:hypothetical protein M9Y10_029547 [Tritrichomonas musculus]|uniref:Protein kinase domain-containing protein n=1 Tax=Tritrichomonas musculus TaxID=1915356 RepID=A0ABR2KNC8_9EUKA
MFPGTTIKINFQDFLTFIQLLRDNAFNITNKNFFITKFSIFFVNNNFDEIKSKINLNAKESKMIVMNQIELFDHNQKIIYSIHVFENTLMLASENDTNKFLSENQHIPVLFLHKKGKIPVISKEIINDSIFQEENQNLKNKFVIQQSNEIFRKIWSFIIPCITGYLIKKSYEKTKKDRTLNHIHDSNRITVKKEDFVVLRNLGIGSIFRVDLIYHLKRCELMAMKIPHFNDDEVPKLIKREKENYKKLNHIFLPKFFDTPEGENYLVMEFINGKTLNYIDRDKLSYNDAVTIVFELIVIFEYLHSKKLIYRDLKPNNIIIDENKNAVLIDFDRLISNNPDGEYTSNLGGLGSEKCLGVIFYSDEKYGKQGFDKAIHYLSLAANQNHQEAQFNLGFLYYEGKFKSRDIQKAIHYFTLCANQRFSEAQYMLGNIYHKGKYILPDINKAIYYYTLAANQNHSKAQYYLGLMYYEGKYIERNIKKGILLVNLASINRFFPAHFVVGCLYHQGKYIDRDIEQAIHYYKEGSSFNDKYAKNNLAIIYKMGYKDKIPARTMNAIEYLKEAIHKKNDILAKYNLANIYIYDETIRDKIDDAIELLFNSIEFPHSYILLFIALLKKYGFKLNEIEKHITELNNKNPKSTLPPISDDLCRLGLNNDSTYKILYEIFKDNYLVYDPLHKIVCFSDFLMQNNKKGNQINVPNITNEFYEGFGIEI